MTSNIRQFQTTLKDWEKLIDKGAWRMQRRLAFLILGAFTDDGEGGIRQVSGLLQMTPVDTGQARGNWQVSAGTPILSVTEFNAGVPHQHPPTSEEYARAAGALAAAKPFGVVYIVNNLPYIVALNNGHSGQISAGWVEQAIANAQAELAR